MVGGAIALALAKSLIYKGTLSPEEAKVIFAGAEKRLAGLSDAGEANRIIEELHERLVKKQDFFNQAKSIRILCATSSIAPNTTWSASNATSACLFWSVLCQLEIAG